VRWFWAGQGPLSGHQDDLAESGPAGGLGQFHGRGHLGQRLAGGDLRGEHAVGQQGEQVAEIGAQPGQKASRLAESGFAAPAQTL
jgi:hypothetical protein